MRSLLVGFALLALSMVLLTNVEAGGGAKKDVVLKGKITCAKCDLGTESSCATVIVTKMNGKDVTVYFDAPSHKKHHGAICSDPKDGTVTGTLKSEGDKKIVSVKDVKFD